MVDSPLQQNLDLECSIRPDMLYVDRCTRCLSAPTKTNMRMAALDRKSDRLLLAGPGLTGPSSSDGLDARNALIAVIRTASVYIAVPHLRAPI